MRSVSKGGDLLVIYYSVFELGQREWLSGVIKRILFYEGVFYAKFYPVYP